MRAKVNEEFCNGCGPCEDICPEVFRIEEGVSKVQVDTVPHDVEDACREAMEQCPTEAISIEE
jgi:ferredoxin